MVRFRNTAAFLMAGAALAGCGPDMSARPEFASNRSLYPENQPVVERTNYVFDVATDGNGVPAGEIARLTEWFDSLQLRYGDRIAVDDPYDNLDVRADIAKTTGYYGILLSDGAPVTAGSVPAGTARVIVSRSTASVPGCPNWRQAKMPGSAISTESNFGCSINSNLAAMIANPEDLVLGQEGFVPGDPNTAARAVRQYRNATPTGAGGLPAVSTGGK